MKKQIGQRAVVNPDLKTAVALVEMFTPRGPRAPNIEYNVMCDKCNAPLKIRLSEEWETGKIWLEGPDKCAGCGHQLSDPNSTFTLSQEEIEAYFGKH